MGSGPVWQIYADSVKYCDTSYGGWWLRILFVDNLTTRDLA